MSRAGTIVERKTEIRLQMRSSRYRLGTREHHDAGCKIILALSTWDVLTCASAIVAYSGLADEPDIAEAVQFLIATGASVFLPRYSEEQGGYEVALLRDVDADLVPGHYGIAEPRRDLPAMSPSRRDSADTMWLVPGLAFDPEGTRIGRGVGYYDRMLANARGAKTGVTYQHRVLDKLPRVGHDVSMVWLMTEEKITKCTRRA